ncbi:MAG: hypothetical protein HOO10_11170 [Candidatus Marinimicrobia bacterium]|jgi:hypothetical protein|nr:hypothetical protein [Candidatus Neomarinimicrobiota bacterium]
MSKRYNWIHIRHYQYTSLKTSIIIDGLIEAPALVWGIKRAGRYKEDSKGTWYMNYPSVDEMAKKILNNDLWFKKKIKEKEQVYKYFLEEVNILITEIKEIKKLTPTISIKKLKQGRDLCTAFFPYLEFIRIPTEKIVLDYYNLLKTFLSEKQVSYLVRSFFYKDKANREYFSHLASFLPPVLLKEFFIELYRVDIDYQISKKGFKTMGKIYDFEFPPQAVQLIPESLLRSSHKVIIPKRLRKYFNYQDKGIKTKVQSYHKVLPKLLDSRVQSKYLYRSFKTVMNHHICCIGAYLRSKGKVKKMEDILEMNISDIEKLLSEDAK